MKCFKKISLVVFLFLLSAMPLMGAAAADAQERSPVVPKEVPSLKQQALKVVVNKLFDELESVRDVDKLHNVEDFVAHHAAQAGLVVFEKVLTRLVYKIFFKTNTYAKRDIKRMLDNLKRKRNRDLLHRRFTQLRCALEQGRYGDELFGYLSLNTFDFESFDIFFEYSGLGMNDLISFPLADSLLNYAILELGNPEHIAYLLGNGANVQKKSVVTQNVPLFNALHFSNACTNRAAVIKMLLDAGADPECTSRTLGVTPLQFLEENDCEDKEEIRAMLQAAIREKQG